MSFISDLEAQMKDVFSTQPVTKHNIANRRIELNKRLSMQKRQEWVLHQMIMQHRGKHISTDEYYGEFC